MELSRVKSNRVESKRAEFLKFNICLELELVQQKHHSKLDKQSFEHWFELGLNYSGKNIRPAKISVRQKYRAKLEIYG